ncbi:testis-specific serine/threonine-protein kinase 3-like [Liolophura sinensis]|uniref:testis-specific serine/threonine-protein kinase 3-like n=1 Tax=Liolophura sinensis TaxID=3198878 RepID=UPI003158D9EE
MNQPPRKRPRIEMEEEIILSNNDDAHLQRELDLLKTEVESVKAPLASKSEDGVGVLYAPTYRAVLAQHGYLARQTLGSGSYSKVKFAQQIGGRRERVAVKIVDRLKAPKDFQQRFLPRELHIWPLLKHQNIVNMYEYFTDNRRVYMILEYAEKGDVLRFIQKNGALTEEMAKLWAQQVCDAINFLHDQDIAHRDLKLENLLLDSGFNIKLCDFGFVKGDCVNDLSKTYCGSKSYAAPEILKGEPYDAKEADVWALGVIIYIFVTGKMPFDESRGNKGVLEEHKKLDFPWHRLKRISKECKELINFIFQFDFRERPCVKAVNGHHWFKTRNVLLTESQRGPQRPPPADALARADPDVNDPARVHR